MAISTISHPIPSGEIPLDLSQFCGSTIPIPKKKMAAGGIIPLSPPKLVTVLYQLTYDADKSVAGEASASLAKLPQNVLEAALAFQDLDHRVLDHLASLHADEAGILKTVVQNRNTADATLLRIVKEARDDALLELIAVNEERLLRAPDIIEAFYLNRHARMSTAERLVELAVRNNVELTGLQAYNEIKASITGQRIVEPTEEPAPQDEVFTQTLLAGGVPAEDFDTDEGFGADEEFDDDLLAEMEIDGLGDSDEGHDGLQNAISKMGVSQKIRLAQIGTAMHRSILIRDTNKLVYESVIKSPAISLQEVARYAQNRSLHEDIVRHIADNKDWTRFYSIKVSLSNNPKTPLSKAMTFLNHLRDRDLKSVASNRNIPSAVANAAKNIIRRKMK